MQSQMLLISFLILSLVACDKDTGTEPSLPSITGQNLSVLESNEGSKNILLDLRLDKASETDVELIVSTEDVTATAGEDYEALDDLSVTFDAGKKLVSVPVTIYGDLDFELDETFELVINEAQGATYGSSPMTITIENDDLDTSFTIPGSGYSTPADYDGMVMIWSDEFDGTTPNPDNWTFETGNGTNGWGNNELEFYQEDNAFLKQGNLVIEAREESRSGFNYTSSRMITANKFDFRYGRIDIRAALPQGQGIWPALWMLGANISTVGWPACGEIDIMEMIGGQGRDNTVHGTAHWSNSGSHAQHSGKTSRSNGSFQNEFHVYTVIWNENSIKWYVDDEQFHELSITGSELSEFRENHFIIFNVAVGGNWPGSPDNTTVFPQRMVVDYVRVFQDEG